MTEFSGISGVKGCSFLPPSVDKQLPLPEKGVHPSYTQERFQEMTVRPEKQAAEVRSLVTSLMQKVKTS